MPKQQGEYRKIEDDPPEVRDKNCQGYWYNFASQWAKGKSVLDVGSGAGHGLKEFIEAGASSIYAIDPKPINSNVLEHPIEKLRGEYYDLVTCIDVIEHVEDDKGLLEQLWRVTKPGGGIFITTPNWNASKCLNKYHYREYTPEELADLFFPYMPYCDISWFTSSGAWPVKILENMHSWESQLGVLIKKSAL